MAALLSVPGFTIKGWAERLCINYTARVALVGDLSSGEHFSGKSESGAACVISRPETEGARDLPPVAPLHTFTPQFLQGQKSEVQLKNVFS